jgi:hypothetical protein
MTWLTIMEYLCHKWPRIYLPLVVNTSRSFPHSQLITGFVTRLPRRVPLVEQEIPTLPEHLSSPPVFSGVRVIRSLVLCVCFVNRCMSFCPFSLVLCVLLRFTDSDYPFGIFKLSECFHFPKHFKLPLLCLPLENQSIFNFMCCVLLIIVHTFDHCIVYGSVIDGFWSLHCLSFCDRRLLIIALSIVLW